MPASPANIAPRASAPPTTASAWRANNSKNPSSLGMSLLNNRSGPNFLETGGGAEREATGRRAAASAGGTKRSEEHTSELQSLMRISYAVFCLKKKKKKEYIY